MPIFLNAASSSTHLSPFYPEQVPVHKGRSLLPLLLLGRSPPHLIGFFLVCVCVCVDYVWSGVVHKLPLPPHAPHTSLEKSRISLLCLFFTLVVSRAPLSPGGSGLLLPTPPSYNQEGRTWPDTGKQAHFQEKLRCRRRRRRHTAEYTGGEGAAAAAVAAVCAAQEVSTGLFCLSRRGKLKPSSVIEWPLLESAK